MRTLSTETLALAATMDQVGVSSDRNLFTPSGWHTSLQHSLVNIPNRLATSLSLPGAVTDDSKLVERYCPSLTLALKVLYSALWDSVSGKKPRQPENSDFLDAVHAMYAPYVRVFRADRYMAPHVRKHASVHGTIVVNRLLDLPDVIHSLP